MRNLTNLHLRLLWTFVVIASAWGTDPCQAQLLAPGDYNGRSFNQWGVDYVQWVVETLSAGKTPPDTVNGVRYLPTAPDGVQEFSADLTIQPGIALFGSPFFVGGERYDNRAEDDPNDPIVATIFEEVTIRTILDGQVLLDGPGPSLANRGFGPTNYPEPILYLEPQPRGPDGSPTGQGFFAVANLWARGFGTMFAGLTPGLHTLRLEHNSEFFGGEFTATYRVNVVPEPSGGLLISIVSLAGIGSWLRRRRFSRGAV